MFIIVAHLSNHEKIMFKTTKYQKKFHSLFNSYHSVNGVGTNLKEMGSVCVYGVFVNVITCEIIDLASPNSVRGSLLARCRMSLYMGHLDLLSRSPQPAGGFLFLDPCSQLSCSNGRLVLPVLLPCFETSYPWKLKLPEPT